MSSSSLFPIVTSDAPPLRRRCVTSPSPCDHPLSSNCPITTANLTLDHPCGKPTYISSFWTSRQLPLYRYDQVPSYLQDNPHIRTGYRSGYTYTQAWQSILFIHNETGNIWTHLLGLVLFIFLIAVTNRLLPSSAHWSDHILFILYFLSACACFLFSTCFHTHYGNNRHAYVVFGCLDYAGISILICGSSGLLTYYTLYCHPFLRNVYLVSLISVSLVGIIGPYFPIWPTARFRVWRTLIYIASSIFSGLPVFHYILDNGIPDSIPWWGLYGWFVMGFTYIIGAIIYASKVPERWFPGKMDVLGHSHQIWHIAVVIAALVHGYSALELMNWRLEQFCS